MLAKLFQTLKYSALIVAISVSANALKIEEDVKIKGFNDISEIKKSANIWKLFAETKEIKKRVPNQYNDFDEFILPGYTEQIKKLNGKTIKISGFMFPLQNSEKQTSYLIGPFPASCPYHYHVIPSLVIEVKNSEPVKFTYDAISLEGKLVLPKSDENGVFYYLENARIIKPES
jgi:hypothetical protein